MNTARRRQAKPKGASSSPQNIKPSALQPISGMPKNPAAHPRLNRSKIGRVISQVGTGSRLMTSGCRVEGFCALDLKLTVSGEFSCAMTEFGFQDHPCCGFGTWILHNTVTRDIIEMGPKMIWLLYPWGFMYIPCSYMEPWARWGHQ